MCALLWQYVFVCKKKHFWFQIFFGPYIIIVCLNDVLLVKTSVWLLVLVQFHAIHCICILRQNSSLFMFFFNFDLVKGRPTTARDIPRTTPTTPTPSPTTNTTGTPLNGTKTGSATNAKPCVTSLLPLVIMTLNFYVRPFRPFSPFPWRWCETSAVYTWYLTWYL